MASIPDQDTLKIEDVSAIDPSLEPYACLVAAESKRRDSNRRNQIGGDLAQFEKTYFGPEVGHVRRVFNKKMMTYMKTGGRLLDFGCGGFWWKSDYWPQFSHVTACEVDNDALFEIAKYFPDVRLWRTRNGVIESEEQFDVVLSSSVVGYILPEQARQHISCAYRLLGDGGQLVMTRVLAFDLVAFIRSRRLVDISGPSFAYHYSRKELETLLKDAGFKNIQYVPLGIRIPGLNWLWTQRLYKFSPKLMSNVLPTILPFLKIQHMLIAEK
jgi:hypothetical protein